MPPDSEVGILCSEPVRGEGTQPRTGKSPCDELTAAFLSAAVGTPSSDLSWNLGAFPQT